MSCIYVPSKLLVLLGCLGVVLGGLGCSTTIKLSCKGLAPSEAGNLIYESTNMGMAALIHCTALHTMQLLLAMYFKRFQFSSDTSQVIDDDERMAVHCLKSESSGM